jgi:hypothetical protein
MKKGCHNLPRTNLFIISITAKQYDKIIAVIIVINRRKSSVSTWDSQTDALYLSPFTVQEKKDDCMVHTP